RPFAPSASYPPSRECDRGQIRQSRADGAEIGGTAPCIEMDRDIIARSRQPPRLRDHAVRVLMHQKDKADTGHGLANSTGTVSTKQTALRIARQFALCGPVSPEEQADGRPAKGERVFF